ncbi:uncharacterized protein CTRU02_204025 [Colletotrichum truncatum]|uniref:Uncharacterized protein n=1 Tax=Colletotrichum truncatum TaxID=5467 RepID=A0ACC3ZAW2_COLTU|nr:uncharacterized protein CTRU02_13618 [Colletotrichum truncatum]KAF6783151.1 hypothetical protein CTRU02_13618 [Colletotrichum truncatum]
MPLLRQTHCPSTSTQPMRAKSSSERHINARLHSTHPAQNYYYVNKREIPALRDTASRL